MIVKLNSKPFIIAEELAEGSRVGRVPVKPGFTYTLNNEERMFSLDSVSGLLTTRARVDREAVPSGQIDLIVLSSSPTYPIEVRYLKKKKIR